MGTAVTERVCRPMTRRSGKSAMGWRLLGAVVPLVFLLLHGAPGSAASEPTALRVAQAGGGFTYGHQPTPRVAGKTVVRVGYFPNLTHAQALIGLADGAFQKALGPDVLIEPYLFNAGPSAVEALFAGSIDLTYIGPNPAINAYVKSKGEAARIVAGACSGGAGLVVRAGTDIKGPADFHGKRIATPQLGNTQDVAARIWLKRNGLPWKEKGGDVDVIPLRNPDQLTLFLKKDIDAAWAVEPWVSRLIVEAGGLLFLDERSLWPRGQFATVQLLASTRFIQQFPDLLARWLTAHVDLTAWIKAHPQQAKESINREIERLTGKGFRTAVLEQAFGRVEFTYDPIKSSLESSATAAYELGFLGKERPNLRHISDLAPLKAVLKQKGLTALRD
jgi:NitT/TauT family transport system substrate-binding protein